MRHQAVGIDAVGAQHDQQPGRILVIGFVTQVRDHRQLLCLHLLGDLLQHARARDLVRQRGDHDVPLLALPHGARAQTATTARIHRLQLVAWRDDFGLGGVIGTLHPLAQFLEAAAGLVQQLDAGRRQLAQVVRRYIGGHADRDPGRAIEQDMRSACRQYGRLIDGAVEIG